MNPDLWLSYISRCNSDVRLNVFVNRLFSGDQSLFYKINAYSELYFIEVATT